MAAVPLRVAAIAQGVATTFAPIIFSLRIVPVLIATILIGTVLVGPVGIAAAILVAAILVATVSSAAVLIAAILISVRICEYPALVPEKKNETRIIYLYIKLIFRLFLTSHRWQKHF
jgi:hypothetical protein